MRVVQERVKRLLIRIEKDRGLVYPAHRLLAERDPDFMELFHKSLMHVFFKRKSLSLKFKEIISVCIDAVVGSPEAIRIHTRKALAAGASEDEILEALELTTLIGMRSITVNMPAIVEEVQAFQQKHKTRTNKSLAKRKR